MPSFAFADFASGWKATSTVQKWIMPTPILGTFPPIQVPWVFATSTDTASKFLKIEGLTGYDFFVTMPDSNEPVGMRFLGRNSLSGDVSGGGIEMSSGNGSGTGGGGSYAFVAGTGGATSGEGGSFQIYGGTGGDPNGNGGYLQIVGGDGVGTGRNGPVKFDYPDDNNRTLMLLDTELGNLGIGTTSPYERLSVAGRVVADSFHATSTTATSTFNGGLTVDGNTLTVGFSQNRVGIGVTSPQDKLHVNGGIISGTSHTIGSAQDIFVSGNGNTLTLGSDYAFLSGQGNTINAVNAAIIGQSNTVSRTGAIAIGSTNTIDTDGSLQVAIGYGNTIQGDASYAIGYGNTCTGLDSYCIGQAVNATAQESMVFGTGFSVGTPMENPRPFSIDFGVGGVVPTLTIRSQNGRNQIGRVGIGTTSPLAGLTVSATSSLSNIPIFNVWSVPSAGATTSSIIATSDGRVGIGATSTLSTTFGVQGTGLISGNLTAEASFFTGFGSGNRFYVATTSYNSWTPFAQKLTIEGDVMTYGTHYISGGLPGFWLNETNGAFGNFGIYVLYDNSNMQFQARNPNFGSFLGSIFQFHVSARSAIIVDSGSNTGLGGTPGSFRLDVHGLARVQRDLTATRLFATTTIGIASTSPWGLLSISATSSLTNLPLVAISTSTSNSTTTVFKIDSNGFLHLKATSTPASSTATCEVGRIWTDVDYIYICIGTNNIKRATLNTF